MELSRKKELLRLVDSIGKDINNQNCGNYIPKVINSINIARTNKDISMFMNVLEKMKFTTFGGNAEKNGFAEFVNKIIKKPEYNIKSLSLDELEFVFAWVARVIKKPEKNSYGNKVYNNRNSYENHNNSYHNGSYTQWNKQGDRKKKEVVYSDEDIIEDNPFASLLGKFK